MLAPVKLQKGLFIGDFPLSQPFGNDHWLTINGKEVRPVVIYGRWGLLGHNGLDYALDTGTPLTSCITGTVIESAYDGPGYGNYIKIENNDCGVIYAHLKRLSDYKVGRRVVAGDVIGVSGNTGNSTGPHLHFGVFLKPRDRRNGYSGYVDPFDKSKIIWVDDINVKPESEAIAELKETLKGVRKSRGNWKRDHKKVKRLLDKSEKANEILLKKDEIREEKMGELINELARFNEGVIDFNLMRKRVQILITPIEEVPEKGESTEEKLKGGEGNG